MWRTYRDAGARALIVAGWPSRPIPGEDLRGRPAGELRALARELPVPDGADVVVDTNCRTASEVEDALQTALAS